MGKQDDKKFTWVIKNFVSLKSARIYSDQFVVGGCKWRLTAYPKGFKVDDSFSLFLEVADYGSLPSGWRRHAKYTLTIVNQISGKPSHTKELQHWFDKSSFGWGYPSMILLSELHAKDSGFLVNGELKIVTEIDLLEVIGKVDVNGFHLLHSEVEFVSRMFERHPQTASEFLPKNKNLRTGYMSLLLSIIETMRQFPHNLPNGDLDDAHAALNCLTSAGFKLDWLEKKLDQVSEQKEKEKAGEIRIQEIESQLKELKQQCSDLQAELEKEKSEVLAAKSPISFDDVI